VFPDLSQGDKEPALRRIGLDPYGASIESAVKIGVPIASAASNLRDARDWCVIYITKKFRRVMFSCSRRVVNGVGERGRKAVPQGAGSGR
jgi:hypothetical protein